MGSSRSLAFAVGGLALLGAGFALGMLFQSAAPPEEKVVIVEERAAAPSVPPSAPAPTPAPPAAVKEPAPEAKTEAPEISADDRAALAALLARVPLPPFPAGDGAITGTVTTDEGAPLEGVEVSCTPEYPRTPRPPARAGELPPLPDPVESALISARYSAWTRETRKVARTDAAGSYRFDGLGGDKHRIEARRPGWQIRPKDHSAAYQARAGAAVDFVASPSVEVRVEVTSPPGTPLDRLQVRFLLPGGGSMGYGLNADNPVIQVKPGSYRALAIAGPAEEWKSEEQAVDIPAEGEPPVLRFTVKGSPGIRARVVFPEGEEMQGSRIFLRRLGEGQKADPALLLNSSDNQTRATERSGTHSWSGLAPGRYGIGVARSHNLPVVVVEEVEVIDSMAEVELRMPPLDPAEFVILAVLGPDGKTERDYAVTTGFQSKRLSSSGGVNEVKRADGTRWILHHIQGSSEEADGTWWVAVSSSRYGTVRADYRKGAQREITIRFEEPGSLTVTLEGYRGHSHEGRLAVAVIPAADAAQGRWSRPSSTGVAPEGTQTFDRLQPGEYQVLLQTTGGESSSTVARAAVTLHGGRNEATVKVPALHALTVTGSEGWVWVRPKTDPQTGSHARAGADGRAVLDGLPAGEYEIRSGSKSATVTIPGTTEVKL
jgi:hypothetical protein